LAITTLIFPATVGQYRNVKLTVVGCSPAWPNAGGAHSGYLVSSDGQRLLLDCGPGVLARLRTREPWPTVEAIVISHLHLDHCGDLVAWHWGALMGSGAGTELWIPPGGRDDLRQLAARFDDVFEVHEYADGERFDAAGFAVTPRRVLHYTQPTWGLRVEAGGRAIAFSADTAPTPALVDLARDADLFLCEATLEGADSDPRGHMSAPEAAAVALQANALDLVLVVADRRGDLHRDASHSAAAPGAKRAKTAASVATSSSLSWSKKRLWTAAKWLPCASRASARPSARWPRAASASCWR
jgi:ribonuclease BN (tRNA processing enzyme)